MTLDLDNEIPMPDGPTIWRFHVVRWDTADVDLLVKYSAAPVRKRLLRLYVLPEDKPDGPPYWDTVSRELIALLEPVLPIIVRREIRLVVSRYGEAPRPVYQLSFENP